MNMSPKAKAIWGWVSGFLAGPVGVYWPYGKDILEGRWSAIPTEAHLAAIGLVLGCLGLLQSKRPGDHVEP